MVPDPIVAITEAVAEVRDTRPTELDLVLNDHINAEAIHQLAADESSPWRLTFHLPEETVTVTSDGIVFVDGTRKRRIDLQTAADD